MPCTPTPSATPRLRHPSAVTLWTRRARERRVVDALRRGASVEAIAEAEKVSRRRMREIVNEVLQRHPELEPADGVSQLRERRLVQVVDLAVEHVQSGFPAAIAPLIRVLREFDLKPEISGGRKPE